MLVRSCASVFGALGRGPSALPVGGNSVVVWGGPSVLPVFRALQQWVPERVKDPLQNCRRIPGVWKDPPTAKLPPRATKCLPPKSWCPRRPPRSPKWKMFVHMVGAKRILLIGRLKGYSILAMAEALPDDGKIISCAVEPYLEVKILFTSFIFLQELVAVGEHFDIVFIDAAQRSAVNYYNFVMDNHLLRMDGVICVENTLMKGQVYLENISDENILAVRNLNNVINSDPRVEQVSVIQLVKALLAFGLH
uniref:Catechol-O-methyltransferase domain containing 1 n=1 Tax=Gopherus agassizii TaxID=38772 RepID=A0A452ISP7_9SAUR